MKIMPRPSVRRLVVLPLAAALLVAGCASGAGPGWTFASLGPTTAPVASPGASGAASPAGSPAGSPVGSPAGSPAGSPGGSPGGSPAGSPAGSPGGSTFEVSTPADQPLAFVPAQLQMPAAASVTVNYLNDSPIEHNINFFAGADSSTVSLGATERVTGPDALRSVTFTTPDQPGDYYFWCDVHLQAMQGTYTVTQ